EQDPAGSDELVPAFGPVAAMGMGERRWRDQQVAPARRDLALLEQELGFAPGKALVEVNRPQQVPVQRLAVACTRIQLAVPIGVSAFAGAIPLQVDLPRTQASACELAKRAVVERGDVLGRQAPQSATAVGLLHTQRRRQG